MIIKGSEFVCPASGQTTANQTVPFFDVKKDQQCVKITKVYFDFKTGNLPDEFQFTLFSQSRNEPIINNVRSTQVGLFGFFMLDAEVKENEKIDLNVSDLTGNQISGNIALQYEVFDK